MPRPSFVCFVGSVSSVPTQVAIRYGKWPLLLAAWLTWFAFLGGCHPSAGPAVENDAGAVDPPAVSRPLRVIVVDDEQLGAVARREWLALSDSDLQLTNLTTETFVQQLESNELSADAIIYPTAWLGTLAEAKKIAEVPARTRETESFGESDIFSWVRRGDLSWGKELYAVPLGSVTFAMIAKSSAESSAEMDGDRGGDKAGDQDLVFPETWSELAAWKFGDEETTRIAQPLAKGWAGVSLLARAAAYSRSQGQVSSLFDFRTMEPLIDSPPFVRALEELVVSAKSLPEQIEWTPWDVQSALHAGKCDVGITWLSRSGVSAESQEADESEQSSLWFFAELPGSREVYRLSESDWGLRRGEGVARVPLVGMSGRIGSVLESSRRQRAAWSFLSKLSASELSTRVSPVSSSTGPFRNSQQAARAWVDLRIGSSDARDYGVSTATAFSHNLVFQTLRIPGHTKYMQSLDTAVRSAVNGEGEASDLLKQVADDWRQRNTTRGLEPQRAAYCRSLGVEP